MFLHHQSAFPIVPCLLLCIGASGRDCLSAGERQATGVDLVCGPRCVDYIYRHYDVRPRPPLAELIQEVQGRDLEKGTSMSLVRDALSRRGVYVAAIETPPAAVIDWPHPVIVHFAGDWLHESGHFSVLLPRSSSDSVDVWMGLPGIVRCEPTALFENISPVVLLTSDQPIANPERAVAGALPYLSTRVIAFSLLFVGMSALLYVYPPATLRKTSTCVR